VKVLEYLGRASLERFEKGCALAFHFQLVLTFPANKNRRSFQKNMLVGLFPIEL